MSADILGTSCDQCRSMLHNANEVHFCFELELLRCCHVGSLCTNMKKGNGLACDSSCLYDCPTQQLKQQLHSTLVAAQWLGDTASSVFRVEPSLYTPPPPPSPLLWFGSSLKFSCTEKCLRRSCTLNHGRLDPRIEWLVKPWAIVVF